MLRLPNWATVLLFVGIAAISLGSAAWLISTADQLETFHQQQAKDKAEAYAHRARIAIARRCRNLPEPQQADCVRGEEHTARQGQHDEYDLEAQMVTSVWTRHMGIAAILGTAFGVIGISLVLATFRENRRSADAAKDSVRLTRELFQIENRPILVPDEMYFEQFTDELWLCKFTWRNVGKLPAVIVGGRQVKFHHGIDGYREALEEKLTQEPVQYWEEEVPNLTPIPSGGLYKSQVMHFGLEDLRNAEMTWAYSIIEYRNALAIEADPWHTSQLGTFFPGAVITEEMTNVSIGNGPFHHPQATAIHNLEFKIVRDGTSMS